MGYLVLLLLGLLVLLPLLGLLQLSALPGFEADNLAFWQSRYIVGALTFSVWQAALSTLLSVLPALWVARAVFYSRHPRWQRLVLRLFGLPLVVPSIVAVLGIVSVYGSNGWIPIGRDLYGLIGILLVHVFFNLPLAIRLLMPAWQSSPLNQFRLGEQLGFTDHDPRDDPVSVNAKEGQDGDNDNNRPHQWKNQVNESLPIGGAVHHA